MILRRWRGAVRPEDAAAYLAHQSGTGVREYRATPGNLGALVLRRDVGDLVEVVTLSWWESMDDVRRFAGDDDLLVEKDQHVDHFEVVESDLDADAVRRLST